MRISRHNIIIPKYRLEQKKFSHYSKNMLSLFPELFTYQQIAPFILRIVLALIFIGSGYSKLFKARLETTKLFQSILVGLIELISGLFFLFGFLTQAVAILVSILVLTTILKVKIKQGFLGGYDFDLLILTCALSLLVLGPGIFAIDLPL